MERRYRIVLLTITYEGEHTQDLGYLLHKNPDRAQQFALSYGKAYVFYPEVSDERTTAALLLDIDPIDLARGKLGGGEGGLFDYVNDRPYAATSFMSNAISRVFGTAMKGRCDKKQQLADTPLPLTATLTSLRTGDDKELAAQLFEPLGYTVKTETTLLDSRFPEWGESPYIDLTISGTVKLSELLNHLYVLIPVFDMQKHYYIAPDEIQKLLDHGGYVADAGEDEGSTQSKGWLASHPYKEKIARRYFKNKQSYARKAIDILMSELPEEQSQEDLSEAAEEAEAQEKRVPLNTQRMEAVRNAVLASGASSVIDLGCGECRLTSLLLSEPQIQRITACDVSVSVLEKAAKRLRLDDMNPFKRRKLTLMQASLTYRDKRFEGFDCACVIEVIEHIEPTRLPAFEQILFRYAAPKTVILTTPNREYNENYTNMKRNGLRHDDHRFEWTREEFRTWTAHICEQFDYTCVCSGIGDNDPAFGTPTQMGVFTRNG